MNMNKDTLKYSWKITTVVVISFSVVDFSSGYSS